MDFSPLVAHCRTELLIIGVGFGSFYVNSIHQFYYLISFLPPTHLLYRTSMSLFCCLSALIFDTMCSVYMHINAIWMRILLYKFSLNDACAQFHPIQATSWLLVVILLYIIARCSLCCTNVPHALPRPTVNAS